MPEVPAGSAFQYGERLESKLARHEVDLIVEHVADVSVRERALLHQAGAEASWNDHVAHRGGVCALTDREPRVATRHDAPRAVR